MKKLLTLLAVSVFICSTAAADRIVVLDENNNIKQEIYTQPMSQQTVTTQPVSTQPQQVYVQPQQVVVTQPTQPVVVVRQRPMVRSYYYDSTATALVAGFTGAVIGNAIFHHHRGGHYHHRR